MDGDLKRLPSAPMPDEARLEGILEVNLDILGLDLMLVGRQVITDYGKRIDLLAIDADGNLAVIELKRDRTPRDLVAQVLDYGSWIVNLGFDDVLAIHAANDPGTSFEESFSARFGASPPEILNTSHSLVIVAAELDASTERIVEYLGGQFGVPVNVVFFRYFIDESREYLARSWLIQPDEAEAKVRGGSPGRRKEQPWNGEDYYVSFGADESRSWEDARKYGFVSGGGGLWYSRSLKMLELDKRVFVCIPGKGYVGVGTVNQTSTMARDFVPIGYDKRLLDLPLVGPGIQRNLDDPETAEWIVGVSWIRDFLESEALWTPGMFANQNTVCRMRNQFTIEQIASAWGLADQSNED